MDGCEWPRTEDGHILCEEPTGCHTCRINFPIDCAEWEARYEDYERSKLPEGTKA
jgi:hypothetical protein